MKYSIFALYACWLSLSATMCAAAEPVNYNRDVRPILNRYCTSCHGGVKQAGDVSFIYRDRVLESGIVIPGDADGSEMIRRLLTDDPDERMPPIGKHPEPLAQDAVQTLKDWINQGATWGNHWSLEPPQATAPPQVTGSAWPKRRVDQWILARLQREGLSPSVEAAPGEWLRRVSFDLTGLPPTPAEYEAFIADCAERPDDREAIYAATVQRLLDSANFGERWAAMWMDVARYADSMGFEKDPHRDMWPYRDWLINAFNSDMPYDEFTTKQLAGDLVGDVIATAFHRNTQTNTEGGTDDEEFRVAAVIDRINTTWTVWQATTFGCVQCHSHPYDPFRNEEFYAFMAFFNNAEDCDQDDDFPTVRIPADANDLERSLGFAGQVRELRMQINEPVDALLGPTPWQRIDAAKLETNHGSLSKTDELEYRAGVGTYPPGTIYTLTALAQPLTAIRLQILPENDDPKKWPETGAVVSRIDAAWVLPGGEKQPIELASVFVDYVSGPFDPSEALRDGAAGVGGFPKLEGPRWAVFALKDLAQPPAGAQLEIRLRQDAQTSGSRPVYVRRFTVESTAEPHWLELAQTQQTRLNELKTLREELAGIQGPRLPVIVERNSAAARATYRFIRGNWLDHGERIEAANTPAVLPLLTTEGDRPTRLDLARWIASPTNPLTARVWVNRIWAELFGIGIVETLEDFGSTGTPPSHPELLDDLALQLIDQHHWRLKPLLAELVMSATYRQSSQASHELVERDPRNRLLARGPRTRLSAEMIRDQALVASGLMTDKVGGPSVMPPQPDGIWRTVYNANQWTTAEGPDRYRRAVYTYWRRTSPYPSSLMFDAPSREFCSARRVSTNTPLQALVTLNDPVYVECSQALAKRAAERAGDDTALAIAWMYRTVTQRVASEATRQQLNNLYGKAQADFVADPSLDKQTFGADAQQFALTIVANTILNLDRAVMK
ncbi:MAG: PSD1 domain-containing protein [Planctomycetales bacterium]|nr:PSD1 domain-containing protein [Planctomycetales bacterium]MCA9166113.1 PSD1 domain-containing protein [Planctomycetales bacterium]